MGSTESYLGNRKTWGRPFVTIWLLLQNKEQRVERTRSSGDEREDEENRAESSGDSCDCVLFYF